MPSIINQTILEELLAAFQGKLDVLYINNAENPEHQGRRKLRYTFVAVVDMGPQELKLVYKDWREFSQILHDDLFACGKADFRIYTIQEFNSKVDQQELALDARLWCELYRRRNYDWMPRPPKPVSRPENSDFIFLTKTHEEGFKQIELMAHLHFNADLSQYFQGICGGIKPRTFPLITGPSATGKTHMAKQIAQAMGAKLIIVPAGNWVPIGASTKPCTKIQIMEQLLLHERVILFIDELDKIEEVKADTDWRASCRADIYSVLDQEFEFRSLSQELAKNSKALYDKWSLDRVDLDQLARTNLFIMAAGTWQREVKKLRVAAKGSGFGFGQDAITETGAMREHLKGNALIAEELRNRFHQRLIELRYPTRTEGLAMLEAKGLLKVARDFGRMDLIESIDWENGGLRNVESIVAELAMQYIREPVGL